MFWHSSGMRFLQLIPLLLLSSQAQANPAMSAAEFDAYTRGKTMIYSHEGTSYGAERYMENRRVIWSFLDGKCRSGVWFEDAGLICFVYETDPDPQCWAFSETPGGLDARFENGQAAEDLYQALDTGEDMLCLGPEVGV